MTNTSRTNLLLNLPDFPSDNWRQDPPRHSQNSVKRERPQNKNLKPFKSRAELGGELDPRINVGGRPKILREETAKWLAERDKTGKTNARKIVESVGTIAIGGGGQSVAAFKALREIANDDQDQKTRPFYLESLNVDILRLLQTIEVEEGR